MKHSHYANLLGAMLALCWAAPVWAVPPATIGEGDATITLADTGAEHALPIWTYRPAGLPGDSPIVIVLHGTHRDASRYRDDWAPLARRYHFLVAVPEFSRAQYPSARSYNQGGVFDAHGHARPRDSWVFASIERVFDRVKLLAHNHSSGYLLYGHSAGAQVVHRMVLLYPEARWTRAIAANPGFYCMPDLQASYPYGLAGTPTSATDLRDILRHNFAVLLGAADTNENDPDLQHSLEAEAQGKNRLERGKTFFAAARGKAKALDCELGWKLEIVPETGHHDAKMAESAAELLMAKAW